MHGDGNGHALCPSQLEHALHVFSEKWGFDRKVLRREPADQLLHLLVDQLQPLITVLADRQSQDTHFDQANPVTHALHQTIPHDDSTRIDPQNYFSRLLHREDYF